MKADQAKPEPFIILSSKQSILDIDRDSFRSARQLMPGVSPA